MATEIPDTQESTDRRRLERRVNNRLADLTLPELRRMLITTTLFVAVAVLFLWMVRTVIIATILGIIVGAYMRPVYLRLERKLGSSSVAALISMLGIVLPILAVLIYSYVEIKDVAAYISTHQNEIALKIDTALHKLPFLGDADTSETIRQYVIAASDYGTNIPGMVRKALSGFAIAATIFAFTTFYVLVDAENISQSPPGCGGIDSARGNWLV